MEANGPVASRSSKSSPPADRGRAGFDSQALRQNRCLFESPLNPPQCTTSSGSGTRLNRLPSAELLGIVRGIGRILAKTPKPTRVPPEHVCQFLIVLPRTEPLVCVGFRCQRRIRSGTCTWRFRTDGLEGLSPARVHRHRPEGGRIKRIGIPDDEWPDERPCLAGWKIPIGRYLTFEQTR